MLPARGYDARVDDIVAAAGVSRHLLPLLRQQGRLLPGPGGSGRGRLSELIDRLDLAAPPDDLQAWLRDWLAAYRADRA